MEIPIIDISVFDGENLRKQQQICHEINCAFRQIGFLHIRFPNAAFCTKLTKLRSEAFSFFRETSDEHKTKCENISAPVPRGFSPANKENFAILSGEKCPNDLVEKYRMGPFDFDKEDEYYVSTKEARMMYYPNIWPSQSNRLQQAMEEYYKEMEALQKMLLRIFEKCLGLSEGFFEDKFDKHTSILSANYYPPIENLDLVEKDQLRLAKHTDVDLFTIVANDEQDKFGNGLQILLPNCETETWIPAPSVPGTVLVNIGDGFKYWTNNKWLSTTHRVVVPCKDDEYLLKSRLSIAYFCGANFDAPVKCITDEGDEAKYKDTTYVGWRKERIKEAMKQLKKNKIKSNNKSKE